MIGKKSKGSRQSLNDRPFIGRSINKIVLIYAGFSALWIYFSDTLVSVGLADPKLILFASILKGLLFVLVTACLLYFLLRRYLAVFACQDAELRKSEECLSRVLTGSRLGFWDWNIATNEVRRNAIWAEMLGYAFEDIEFTTRQWTDFVHPEDRERAWASINAALDGRAAEHELTYRMKTKDGGYKWILDRARVVERDAGGKPLRMSGTHTDVDKIKLIEHALLESEKRFRGIFENAAVGIAQVSLDGAFLLVNDTFCAMTGYSCEELLNEIKYFQQITFPDDLEADLRMRDKLLEGLSNSYDIEKRYIRKDGSIAWVHLSRSLLRDADNRPDGFIGAVQDITKLKKLQEELEMQARIDYLTGIPNRRYFMELAEHELARAQRYAMPLAVIMIDVDYFKQINDRHGHKAGDTALRKIARLMQDALREVDIIARLGGEEFAILLPQTDKQRALEVAERLQTAVAGTAIALDSGKTVKVTISLGVNVLDRENLNIDGLLAQADKGLYQAKATGRNKTVFAAGPPSGGQ